MLKRDTLRANLSRLPTKAARGALAAVAAAIVISAASPAQAVKIPVNEETFINLNLLMQPWYQLRYQEDAEPSFQNDFFVRRTRILLGGQVSKWVSFFMETDMPNWGANGDWTSPTLFVQDAFVRFNLHEAFNITGGMLLTPFSRNFFTSAAKLHTIDYHTALAMYPAGGHKVWRDNGLMLSGLLVNKMLEYRLAITQGVPGTPDDIPRVTGRVSFNLFDPEGGMFPSGIHLGQQKVVSIGVATDYQKDAIRTGGGVDADGNPIPVEYVGDYIGLAGDVFWDLSLGNERALTGVAAFLYYGGDANPNKGIGAYFDTGVSFGKWEPIVSVEWFKPDGADTFDGHMLNIFPGLNYWLHGFAANIKFELRLQKNSGIPFDKLLIAPTAQTQLFF